MAVAKLSDHEVRLLQAITETYALPSSPHYLDPMEFNRLLRRRVPPRGQRFANDHRDTCAYIERSKNANVVAYTANFIVPAQSADAAKALKPCEDDPAFEAERQAYEKHYHYTYPSRDQGVPAGMVVVPSGRGITCEAHVVNPAHAYFVRLEPSYVEARRKKGILVDCDELKMLERRFAYGYNTKRFEPEQHVAVQLVSHTKATGPLQEALQAAGEGAREVVGSLTRWWQATPALVMSFAPLPAWPAFAFTLKPLPAEDKNATAPSSATEETPDSWLHAEDTAAVLVALIDGDLCVLEKVYVKSVEHWFGLPTVDYIEVFGVCLRDGSLRRDKQLNNGKYEAPKGVTAEDIANS